MRITDGLENVLSTTRMQFIASVDRSLGIELLFCYHALIFPSRRSSYLSLRSLPVFSLLLGDILCAADVVSLLVRRKTNIYSLTKTPAAGGKFCSSVEQYT